MQKQKKEISKRFTGRPKREEALQRGYQLKICTLLALNYPVSDVLEIVKDEYDIEMSAPNIYQNYIRGPKWRPLIKKLRARYCRRFEGIPLAKKENRLMALQWAVKEACTWRTKSVGEFGSVEERKIGLIPSLLEQIRKEIEGERPLFEEHKHFHLGEQTEDVPLGKRIKGFTHQLSQGSGR